MFVHDKLSDKNRRFFSCQHNTEGEIRLELVAQKFKPLMNYLFQCFEEVWGGVRLGKAL